MAESGQVVRMQQLTLDAGGATVDSAEIASVKWAAGTKPLTREFKKGSDIEIRLIARVVEVKVKDVYDAHGNISETIRGHVLRVDDTKSVKVANEEAYLDDLNTGEPAE